MTNEQRAKQIVDTITGDALDSIAMKSSTVETLTGAAIQMIEAGVSDRDAIELLGGVAAALRDEFSLNKSSV